MSVNLLKRFALHLPFFWQQELKRIYYRNRINHQTFESEEPEFLILDRLVTAGDWAIDIGANVGHYTKKLSDLVGPRGRVIAIEPVPDTFGLLVCNVLLFRNRNVTVLNLAASDQTSVAGMRIPKFDGLKNYYRAALTAHGSALQVMTIALDSLALHHRIRLIKIDAEGHDPIVLRGLERLITRDHPTLIIEESPSLMVERLAGMGYDSEKLPGSPNMLFSWRPKNEKNVFLADRDRYGV